MGRYNVLATVVALTVVSIITAFVLTITLPGRNPFLKENNVNLNQSDVPVPGESAEFIPTGEPYSFQYILKDYEGKLAVYLPDASEPEKIFNVYLSTLPPFDRGQLQQGVKIKDYAELVQRIEDYIS